MSYFAPERFEPRPHIIFFKNSHEVVVTVQVLLQKQELAPRGGATPVDLVRRRHNHVVAMQCRVSLFVVYCHLRVSGARQGVFTTAAGRMQMFSLILSQCCYGEWCVLAKVNNQGQVEVLLEEEGEVYVQ